MGLTNRQRDRQRDRQTDRQTHSSKFTQTSRGKGWVKSLLDIFGENASILEKFETLDPSKNSTQYFLNTSAQMKPKKLSSLQGLVRWGKYINCFFCFLFFVLHHYERNKITQIWPHVVHFMCLIIQSFLWHTFNLSDQST